eukprot:gene897-401_t
MSEKKSRSRSRSRLNTGTSSSKGGKTWHMPHSRRYLLDALILCVTVAVYCPVFKAPFWGDDDLLIRNNPILTEAFSAGVLLVADDAGHPIFNSYVSGWHPFTMWSFRTQLVNVLLHAFVAILLSRICEPSRELAVFVGLGFAVHPAATGAVCQVAGHTELLGALFTLLVVYNYPMLPEGLSDMMNSWGLGILAMLSSDSGMIALPIACFSHLQASVRWRPAYRNVAILSTQVTLFVAMILNLIRYIMFSLTTETPAAIDTPARYAPNLSSRIRGTSYASTFGLSLLPNPTNFNVERRGLVTFPDIHDPLNNKDYIVIGALAIFLVVVLLIRPPVFSVLMMIGPVLPWAVFTEVCPKERYLYMPLCGFILSVMWSVCPPPPPLAQPRPRRKKLEPPTPIKIGASPFLSDTDVENENKKSSELQDGKAKKEKSCTGGNSPKSGTSPPFVDPTASGSDVDATEERKRGKKVLRRRLPVSASSSNLFEQQTVAQGCLITGGATSSSLGSPSNATKTKVTGEGGDSVILKSFNFLGFGPLALIRWTVFMWLAAWLAAKTTERCKDWADPEQLARNDIVANPTNAVAWVSYAGAIVDQGPGHYHRAETAYEKAWKLDKKMIPAALGLAELMILRSGASSYERKGTDIQLQRDVEALRYGQRILHEALHEAKSLPRVRTYAMGGAHGCLPDIYRMLGKASTADYEYKTARDEGDRSRAYRP